MITTRPSAPRVFHVDPSSLSICDDCLTVDGAGDNVLHSIHLVFIESGDDRIDLFHFPEDQLVALNGVLASSRKDGLLNEVREHQTITLWVTDTDDNIRLGSMYPAEPEDPTLGIDQLA